MASNIPMLAIVSARISACVVDYADIGNVCLQTCGNRTTDKNVIVNPRIKMTTRNINDVCIIRYLVIYTSTRNPNSGKSRRETPIPQLIAVRTMGYIF